MKKATRILGILLAIIMVMGMLAGCGGGNESQGASSNGSSSSDSAGGTGSQETGAGGSDSKETYDVACIFRIGDMYAAWLKQAFEADAGNHPNLNVTVFDNQDDTAKHIEVIETCIEQGYDYIVVQARLGDLSDVYKKAIDAGIKMIQITYAEEWTYNVLHSILCDEIALSSAIAKDAAEKLPENAKVCFLNGPAGISITEDRRRGFQEGLLDARPDITLLDEQDASFAKDTAMNKVSDWLQVYDQIDAILCASDSMAVGAIEAYKANNVDTSKTLFYGIDGLTESVGAILDGTMEGSALQDATYYASTCLGLISQDVAGEIDLNTMIGSKEAAVTEFSPRLLDKSNAQEQFDYYTELGLVK